MYCPYCGTQNDAAAKNCGKCGAAMPVLARASKPWQAFIPGQGLGCMLGLAALGIMSLAVILPQYRLAHLQVTATKNAVVISNMRALRVALDQYAAEHDGYPATLEPNGTDPATQDVSYIAMQVRQMRDPFDPLTPAVAVSPTDPPDWKQVKRGQVIYVPLEVASGKARSYIIYGMGKDWPLTDVMRGGYGQ